MNHRVLLQKLHIPLACICVFMISCLTSALADGTIIRDSKGTEFWLAFLPNLHNSPQLHEDSLYIYITAEQPANGSITYTSRSGNIHSIPFSIQADEFYTLAVVFDSLELSGYSSPNPSTPKSVRQNETPVRQVVHITSNTEVSVYGLNKAVTTSDAFIALPQDVLGQEYLVCSYAADPGDPFGNNQATPSEFAIVATQNNTQITITPPTGVPTSGKGTSGPQSGPRNITLMAGDAFLVQTVDETSDDLTGTKIISNQPIAVFAGHQRLRIPDSLSSRDHIVEQLNPIPTWGGSAFVTPYPLAKDATPEGTDIYRVLAAQNNTKVYIDGKYKMTLQAGEFHDFPLVIAEWVTATGPILVAQYKKSSNKSINGSTLNSGDPFMIINSPIEQYLKRFHCFNIQVIKDGQDVYGAEQYLTIIVPTDSVATVKLDGNLIAPSKFRPLSITSYSYTDSMHVTSGAHTIESNAEMGVYVYGYGGADSYGYIGGMKYDTIYKFDPPDIIPPQIAGTITCDSIAGAVYDTLAFDRGLKSVDSVRGSLKNVTLTINPLSPPAHSTRFAAKLLDKYQDGEFIIDTRDSANKTRRQTFSIPGFTIRVVTTASVSLPVSTGKVKINDKTCFKVDVVNYGKFPQKIDTKTLTQGLPQFTVITPVPITIPPGKTVSIEICFIADHAGIFTDTLVLGNNACTNRQVLALKYSTEAPLQSGSSIQCATLRGTFYDTTVVKLNITTVDTVSGSQHNVDVVLVPFSPGADSIWFNAKLQDPYHDGSGRVEARNTQGVQGWIDFEIPGFTIHPDTVKFQPVSEISDARFGKQTCISINLINYGKFPQTFSIEHATAEYSITPSSLTIPPGATVPVQVCFQSSTTGTFSDSLIINNTCVKRTIANLAFTARRDTSTPSVSGAHDQCAHKDHIVFSDNLKFDWGIESYAVLEKTNCEVTEDRSGLPESMAFDVQVTNPRADARYRVQVLDSAGNTRDTTVILQGFTISFAETQQRHAFTDAFRDEMICDSLKIYNSSELPFVIDNAELFQNVNFSVPLSQFPVTIAAKDTGVLLVCFSPKGETAYNDTLRLAKYCIEEVIQTNGKKSDITLSSNSRCNVNLRVSSSAKPLKAYVEQSYPNPANDHAVVPFGSSAEQQIQIRLYDALGTLVTVLTNQVYASGSYELEIETAKLQSGLYFYEFIVGDQRIVTPMHIVR